MIIQNLLNVIRTAVVSILSGLPEVPLEWLLALGGVQEAGYAVSDAVMNFGYIVPFAAFSAQIGLWTGALSFWLAVQGLRLGLWLFGR